MREVSLAHPLSLIRTADPLLLPERPQERVLASRDRLWAPADAASSAPDPGPGSTSTSVARIGSPHTEQRISTWRHDEYGPQ